jgi:F5/8 type C domain
MVSAWFRSLRAGIVELLLLREAERVAVSHGSRLAVIREHKAKAAADLRAARLLARPDVALVVLEDAMRGALKAVHAMRDATAGGTVDEHTELDALVSAGAPSAAVAAYQARGGVALADFAGAESTRDRIDELVTWTLRRTEARSPLAIRALRYGRVLGLALLVALVAGKVIRNKWMVHNVARDKPVMTSPLQPYSPPASEAVDGKTRGTFGVHTTEGHPFVTVDLLRTYDVESVRVYNRGDGWFGDILPLTLSVSVDGRKFDDIDTRTTHFDMWSVSLGGRPARYVRVSKPSGYMALNEIEVYARE